MNYELPASICYRWQIVEVIYALQHLTIVIPIIMFDERMTINSTVEIVGVAYGDAVEHTKRVISPLKTAPVIDLRWPIHFVGEEVLGH
jgi:hypothetical protein